MYFTIVHISDNGKTLRADVRVDPENMEFEVFDICIGENLYSYKKSSTHSRYRVHLYIIKNVKDFNKQVSDMIDWQGKKDY